MPIRTITAQGPPYLKVMTVKVPPSNNVTSRVFCENGDGIISGGYSIGFHSINSPFNTMVYSNHPLQKINRTGYFEGWEAGLVNKGKEKLTLSKLIMLMVIACYCTNTLCNANSLAISSLPMTSSSTQKKNIVIGAWAPSNFHLEKMQEPKQVNEAILTLLGQGFNEYYFV